MPEVRFRWTTADNLSHECSVEAASGQSLLQVAKTHGIPLEANCGGNGRCGKCKVAVTGQTNPLDLREDKLLSEREKAMSVRLACRCIPLSDVTVQFQAGGVQALTAGSGLEVLLSPDVSVTEVSIPEPTLTEPVADFTRIQSTLPVPKVPTQTFLRRLPETLRKRGPWQLVSYSDRLLDIFPAPEPKQVYGVAVDVGTTTVAVGLSNLLTGEEIAAAADMNRQTVLGADVIARIKEAENPHSLARLQQEVVETINQVIGDVCRQGGIEPSKVYRAVVVGNTCMQHLLLGVNPAYLAQAPYVPAFTDMVTYPAAQLGFDIFPEAPVSLLPSIAGFVGADTVGVIMAAGLSELSGILLAVDIGTNGEIVLSKDGKMLTCSTAAGPAFEGGQIKWGMRAAPGAIDRVSVASGDISFSTIQNTSPAGICGSGLVDLVAVLLDLGVINAAGRLLTPSEVSDLPPAIKRRVIDEGEVAFVLAWENESSSGDRVVLTSRDVRQIQLAKGAIQAGTRVLANIADVSLKSLDGVYLAGAFGNYINWKNAMRIGLLPEVGEEKIRSLGNGARAGARMALLCAEKLGAAVELARSVQYVELSAREDFQMEFMEAMMF